MQEISRANLLAVFGEEYQTQISNLKKITINGVKKIVEAFNSKNLDSQTISIKN